MKAKIEILITDLKNNARETMPYTNKREQDPEAKVNVWYVLSKVEEVLLHDSKNNSMGPGLRQLIAELKKNATKFASIGPDPDAKVNVWYVIARLNEVLLEGKEG